jgi:hypothetical protein
VRERWFGATGRKVPELAIEGDPAVPLDEALVLEDVSDAGRLRQAHEQGTALARPEVAAVLVPADHAELLDLDLTQLTYG